MTAELLREINRAFVQTLPLVVGLMAVLWVVARASERFVATFPDEVAEKTELLQGTRSRWFVWSPVAALVVMYGMIVWVLAPVSGIILGAFILLLPLVLLAFGNQAAFDAPFAALEVMRAKLGKRSAEPERWLAQYRTAKARRQRLGVLRQFLAAMMVLLLSMSVSAYISLDRVLAMRLRAQVLEQALKAELGNSFEGTIFSQTPPCTGLRTMYLIPAKDPGKAQAQRDVDRVVKWLAERQERWAWAVQVKTGEGPPVAEGTYGGRE